MVTFLNPMTVVLIICSIVNQKHVFTYGKAQIVQPTVIPLGE